MNNDIDQAVKSSKKVYFIRVDEAQYQRIIRLAESEDRSINKTANRLIKSALDSAKAE